MSTGDEGDLAADYQARHNAAALAAHRRRRAELPAESASHCGWCEEPIPEARRQAVPGCELCVRCAAERERLKGRP